MRHDEQLTLFEKALDSVNQNINKFRPKKITNYFKPGLGIIFQMTGYVKDAFYEITLFIKYLFPPQILESYWMRVLLGVISSVFFILFTFTFSFLIFFIGCISIFIGGFMLIDRGIDLYNAFIDTRLISHDQDIEKYNAFSLEIQSIHAKIREYEKLIESGNPLISTDLIGSPIDQQHKNLKIQIEKLRLPDILSGSIELEQFKAYYFSSGEALFTTIKKNIKDELTLYLPQEIHSRESRALLTTYQSIEDFKNKRKKTMGLLELLLDLDDKSIYKDSNPQTLMSFKEYFFELLEHKDSPLTPPKFLYECPDHHYASDSILFDASEENITNIRNRYNPLKIQHEIYHACCLLKQEAILEDSSDTKNQSNIELIKYHLYLHDDCLNKYIPEGSSYFNMNFYSRLRASRRDYLNERSAGKPLCVKSEFKIDDQVFKIS